MHNRRGNGMNMRTPASNGRQTLLCILSATISCCVLSPDAFTFQGHYSARQMTIPHQTKASMDWNTEQADPMLHRTATLHKNSSSDIYFASPLLEFGYPPAVEEYENGTTAQKPLLLYLPGFDGTYLSAFFQYPELHTLFEVRCLVSTMDDRSTFDDLKASVLKFILEEIQETQKYPTISAASTTTFNSSTTSQAQMNNSTAARPEEGLFASISSWPSFVSNMFTKGTTVKTRKNATQMGATTISSSKRPVYLAGESFGGILASDVALTLLEEYKLDKNLKGLVLINAATCYDRSKLAAEGPAIYRLPRMLYFFGILRLLPMFLDDVSFPQFLAIIQGKALPSLIDNPIREAYMGRFAFSLPKLLKFMPQDTFQWRLEQWLEMGCNRMASNNRLDDLAQYESLRTLIIAGEKDMALPSIAEAERLAQKLPNSQVHIVDGAGHANTCGSRLDMAAVMRNHFEELQTITTNTRRRRQQREGKQRNGELLGTSPADRDEGRTEMKEVAAEGQGIYFGMEPRYDGKQFGLSPLKYWSKEYYRKHP